MFQLMHNLANADGIFAVALINTILIPVAIVLIGLAANLAGRAVTGLIAFAVGDQAAGVTRNYLTWPGTVMHESAHAALAFLSGARIKEFRIIPEGRTLGYVRIVPRGNYISKGIQITLSSIGPVIAGVAALVLMGHFAFPAANVWWHYLILVYLVVCVVIHMNLSPLDVKNALRGLPVCMIALFIVFLFCHVNLFGKLYALLSAFVNLIFPVPA